MALNTVVPAWVAKSSAAENHSEHGGESGRKSSGTIESGERQLGHVGEEDGKKIYHMAKKKIELEAVAEAKQLEDTERLVEDANLVIDVG
eukprot:CAMPEP_0194402734 /NCGR_PEP_ID=MMETSP0176-20130528/1387_1 /TAXON_ID=216777 /ORGANISM="Proboscia alata, Strain PI-D3" /LENGTH=89 /DNA_ID=CAMNT_0039200205 /DNA_START=34 /DNA_END=300 /DNA_ORIENTATION=-